MEHILKAFNNNITDENDNLIVIDKNIAKDNDHHVLSHNDLSKENNNSEIINPNISKGNDDFQDLDFNSLNFDTLYQKYKYYLLRYVLKHVGLKDEAEEIIQETFIKVIKGINQLKSAKAVLPWMTSITRNVCFDFLRYKQRKLPRQMISFDEIGFNQNIQQLGCNDVNYVEQAEKVQIVQDVVKNLPLKYKQVIVLHDIDGYTYKEIAKILNVEITTIKSRLCYGRNKIRESIKKYNFTYGEG